MRRLLPLLLLVGCEEPPLYVRALDAWTGQPVAGDRPYLTEACELLELECVRTSDKHGTMSLHLWLTPDDWGRSGLSTDTEGCDREIHAAREPTTIAHELMHALGFPGNENHSDDPEDLLHSPAGPTPAPWRLEVVHQEVRLMGACARW